MTEIMIVLVGRVGNWRVWGKIGGRWIGGKQKSKIYGRLIEILLRR
jgi:hypothetical protein